MRISSKTTDRGHATLLALSEAGKKPRVLLDGREVADVVTADGELDEVVRRASTGNDRFAGRSGASRRWTSSS